MGKINLLDSSVFNRIAAGEVVERPASVVKELVENSLDAGATQIRIEILAGGVRQIKVSDNGTGMESTDAERAFLPHATSKIKNVEDLEQIGTLGFRGEALASIASVAQIELTTKTKDAETGQKVTLEGGKLLTSQPVGSPEGTYITVNNLFYNTPARKKFLKSDSREEAEITNLVARLILSNPKISFVYVLNSKEVYRSSGKNLEEALFSVYGKETIENCIPFESKVGPVHLSGYLGKPTYAKSNRTYQTLVINGRYVVNSVVSAASYGAYQNYLMKGKFPFFVLHLNMPYDALDVNVHPNKLDVKFQNSQTIYGIIYNTITQTLSQASNIMKVPSGEGMNSTMHSTPVPLPTREFTPQEGISFSSTLVSSNPIEVELTKEEKDKSLIDQEVILKQKADILESYLNVTSDSIQKNVLKQSNSLLTAALHKSLNQVDALQTQQVQTSSFENFLYDTSNIILVGKVFKTYLIVQKEASMFIIDQHAAHEKLLYDELVKQVNAQNITAQILLVPHILSVNTLEENFIKENLEQIENLGFDIEGFGSGSFKISSVPSVLSGINMDLFFNEILKDMTALNKNKTSDLIKERLMQASCKAAIKAGNDLSVLEINTLFDKMSKTNMTLLCPHGRPVVVEVGKKELDKWFKRIL